MWNQLYNPFNNVVFSTIAAAMPVVTLLVLIASGKVKAHIAAVAALIVANLIAIAGDLVRQKQLQILNLLARNRRGFSGKGEQSDHPLGAQEFFSQAGR